LIFVLILLPVLNHFKCSFILCDNGRLENVALAFKQLISDHFIQGIVCAAVFAVGILNYCAVSVVKESGAVARAIVDTLRILSVWVISLLFKWEPFHYI
jgi:hypothetical protein